MATIDTVGATVEHIASGLIGTVEDVHDYHGIQVRWSDGFVNAGHSADDIRIPEDCPRHGGPWGDDETCPKCTRVADDADSSIGFVTVPRSR